MEEFGLTLVAQIPAMTVLERPATRDNVNVPIGVKKMDPAVHGACLSVVIEQNVMKILLILNVNVSLAGGTPGVTLISLIVRIHVDQVQSVERMLMVELYVRNVEKVTEEGMASVLYEESGQRGGNVPSHVVGEDK